MKNFNVKEFFSKKEVKENLVFIGVLVVVYLIISLSFTYLPFLNKYHIYAIQTNSMEPVINAGDVVIIEEISPKEVEVNDIIAFTVDITNDNKDDVVVHYIADIIEFDEDTLVFKTKPEISDQQDSWTLEEHDIIGVYVRKINNVGKILLFLQSWVGKLVLIIDIIVISIIYDALFKKKKKKTENDTVIPLDEQKEIL